MQNVIASSFTMYEWKMTHSDKLHKHACEYHHDANSFFCFFLLLSTLFVRGGVHSTMLNAVNPGLRPQTAGTQICCFNYQISKTNNKSALDRDTSGKPTRWGLTGGYRRVPFLKARRKSPHVFYTQSFWQYRKLLYLCVNGREVRNFKWLFWDWEVYFTVAFGTRCACLMHDLIPPARQRYALFFAGHPSVSAQLLRFWLYFMSPNCDWPGLPVASFHPGEEGVRSFLISGAFLVISMTVYLPPPSRDGEGHVSSSSSPWVVWLSGYLHLSTGPGSSLHPSPSSFSVRVLNIPRSAPFTAFKQNRFIVYQHWSGEMPLSSGAR